ncbi:MAG: FliM/FliN family flagellar motor switch protein [Planctomycetota bacterium]|nr:FliM/FliN family flagellar motor switch protein [Planctomycetota bacterium]MDA1213359.1 FliM/FliN family flagellar motor switch protein [Planctomycetota bacterium]
MTEINADYCSQLISALPKNIGEISNSLSSCLDETIRLEEKETGKWIGEVPIPGGEGPGLLVSFRLGKAGIVVAIPESFPLPEWYKKPDESETARLQTLAMEWSMNLLPADVDVSEFSAGAVNNIRQAINETQPDVDAQYLVFQGTSESTETASLGKICLIGPVATPAVPSLKQAPPNSTPREASHSEIPPQKADVSHRQEPTVDRSPPVVKPSAPSAKRKSPLLELPVNVVVMLAEKKIELGQLLSLSSGSLISFDKSFDAPLDLFVNNHLFCRGEAIKIGEHFGLKVNEVRPRPSRPTKVF